MKSHNTSTPAEELPHPGALQPPSPPFMVSILIFGFISCIILIALPLVMASGWWVGLTVSYTMHPKVLGIPHIIFWSLFFMVVYMKIMILGIGFIARQQRHGEALLKQASTPMPHTTVRNASRLGIWLVRGWFVGLSFVFPSLFIYLWVLVFDTPPRAYPVVLGIPLWFLLLLLGNLIYIAGMLALVRSLMHIWSTQREVP